MPLYGYWHEAAADHYYTTDLLPFGFDGYVFQGRAGYVFAERSHPGQAAVHQYWNAERTSHRYSTEHAPSGLDGGYAYERCVGYVEAAE